MPADISLYQGATGPKDIILRSPPTGGAQSVNAVPINLPITLAGASSLLETAAGVVTMVLGVVAATAQLTLAVSATPVTLTLNPIAATASPGVLAPSATPATLTLNPVAATASPGAISVSATPFALTLGPVAATGSPGALALGATPVSLPLVIVTASSLSGTLYKDADVISFALGPLAATASPGALSVSAAAQTFTLSPVPALGSPGAISVSAGAVSLAIVPIAGIGGNVSFSTTPPTISFTLVRANAAMSLQQRQEPVAEYSINYQARTYATVGTILRGDVLSRDAAGYYITSTSSARAAGYPAVAVALVPNNASGVTSIKEVGDIDSGITSLGTGSAWPVIVNAAGRMERKQTPGGSDYVIGQSDVAGNVLLVWPAPKVL